MIVDKIYEMLDEIPNSNTELKIPDHLLKEFLDGCGNAVMRQFTKREEKQSIRLSAIGKCLKQQAFTLLGEKGEDLQPRSRFTFFFGDLIEEIVIFLAKMARVNIHSEQKEVVLDEIKGHIDGIVDIEGNRYIFECKSMADFSFKEFKENGMSDDWGYISQINAYMEALAINNAILVGINKNTGHMWEQIFKKDDSIVSCIYSNIQDLKGIQKNPELLNKLESISPIDETFRNKKTGNKVLSVTCSYCKYKKSCFKGLTTAFKNGKPIFYVGDVNKNTVPYNVSFTEI